jgi:hypothetical protein
MKLWVRSQDGRHEELDPRPCREQRRSTADGGKHSATAAQRTASAVLRCFATTSFVRSRTPRSARVVIRVTSAPGCCSILWEVWTCCGRRSMLGRMRQIRKDKALARQRRRSNVCDRTCHTYTTLVSALLNGRTRATNIRVCCLTSNALCALLSRRRATTHTG